MFHKNSFKGLELSLSMQWDRKDAEGVIVPGRFYDIDHP
jgi:hypothetical protein